jgi:hypothetical protein
LNTKIEEELLLRVALAQVPQGPMILGQSDSPGT